MEARARLRALYKLNNKPVVDEEIALEVREHMAVERASADTAEARRSQLPGWRCVQAIMGLFRAAASLRPPPDKNGKRPRYGRGQAIWDLELGAEEIGELIGWKRSTVYAALRWMEPWIRQRRRSGAGMLEYDDGTTEALPLKRTSVRFLSPMGLAKLQLADGPRLVQVVMMEAAMKKQAEKRQQLAFEYVADTAEEQASARAAAEALAGRLLCAEDFALYAEQRGVSGGELGAQLHAAMSYG